MAICEFHLNQNNVLEKMTAFTAIVPDDKPGPFPVLYLLHGLSDDHTAWTRRSNIERYVDGLPLIVVYVWRSMRWLEVGPGSALVPRPSRRSPACSSGLALTGSLPTIRPR